MNEEEMTTGWRESSHGGEPGSEIKLACGCVAFVMDFDGQQIIGADLCGMHIDIFHRMQQLSNPPTLGVSVSERVGTRDKMGG